MLGRDKTYAGRSTLEAGSDRFHPVPAPDFKQLFTENLQFVRRAVASSLGPGDPELEDLVQDVFMVAMDRLHKYDGRCLMTTWLWGIAWRVVSQHRRRRKLRQFLHIGEEAGRATAAQHHDPEKDVVAQRVLTDLYAILDRMPEKRRQVLILHELEGYSGQEIAEILGCKLATVWTRLHYARSDFRERALKSESVRECSESFLPMSGRSRK